MKRHIALPLTIALAATAFQMAHAQTQTQSPTRAEVKAEAIANAASKPKGEMSTPNQDKGMRQQPSTTTRAAVKADLAASRPLSQGEQNTPGVPMSQPAASMGSNKSRAAVKAETAAAEKANPGGLSRGKGVEEMKMKAASAPKP